MKLSLTSWLFSLCLLAACGGPRPLITGDAGAMDSAVACTSTAQCDDMTACTTDRCLVGGVCEHEANNAMCTAPQVCVSGRGCAMPGEQRCARNEDCNDRIDCTRDTCLVEGVCRFATQDAMCAMGQRCDATRGCTTMASRCMSAADCDDTIECTEDTCGVDGACTHVPQNSRCTGGRTCNAGMGCINAVACRTAAECQNGSFCDGAETCNTELACVAGAAVNCDDMDPCTADVCDEGMRMCTHATEPACMGMTVRNGIFDVAPTISYMCTTAIFMSVALNISTTALNVTVSSTATTVTPAAGMGLPMMTGPAPSGGRFRVSGEITGDCLESYALVGTLTDADHFTGRLTLMLTGAGCGLTNCTNQEWNFTGTHR